MTDANVTNGGFVLLSQQLSKDWSDFLKGALICGIYILEKFLLLHESLFQCGFLRVKEDQLTVALQNN